MYSSRKYIFPLLCSMLAGQQAFADETRIPVTASFSILGDLVKQVGQSHVQVSTLVGPNGDAHVFQPSPQDSIKLTQSKLFVVNGLGFEGWMDRLVTASHYKGKVLTASEGIKPRQLTEAEEEHEAEEHHEEAHHHDHGAFDPHAWHSIPNTVAYVQNIAKGLSQIDPEHQKEYQQNAQQYIEQLQELDVSLIKKFSAIPTDKRKMITSHDAFGYLSARYHITILAPQGMSTESEASAKDVAAMIKQIRKENIKALFVENISDPRLIQQLSRETGVQPGKELYSDALSASDGPASTYLDMMRYNTRQILSALNQ